MTNIPSLTFSHKSCRVQFSEIEIQVIKLICEGHNSSEIANMLFRSRRTIEGYRRKILEKTNTRNSAGIAVFAIKYGLYSFD